jgi:hypothetical protein
MALLGLEGALQHYYYHYCKVVQQPVSLLWMLRSY